MVVVFLTIHSFIHNSCYPSNTGTDVFINTLLGNNFFVTAPTGSTLTTMYVYFTNTTTPGNIPLVDSSIIMVSIRNGANNNISVVTTSGSVLKTSANTQTIARGVMINFLFSCAGGNILEISWKLVDQQQLQCKKAYIFNLYYLVETTIYFLT